MLQCVLTPAFQARPLRGISFSCSFMLAVDAGRCFLQTQTLHKLHSDCNSMRCAEHSLAVADTFRMLILGIAALQLLGQVACSELGGWLRPHSRRVGHGAIEQCSGLDLAYKEFDQLILALHSTRACQTRIVASWHRSELSVSPKQRQTCVKFLKHIN